MRVRCTGCRKELNAPDSAAGKVVTCPSCSRKLRLPKPSATPSSYEDYGAPAAGGYDDFSTGYSGYPAAGGSRIPCPMCGEFIAAKAIKCRFCGEELDDRPRRSTSPKRKRRGSSKESKFRTQAIALGGFWIFCGILHGILAPLLLMAVAKDNGGVHPIAYLFLIGVGVVFGAIGALACMRNLIALYVGLVISYLFIVLNLMGMVMWTMGLQRAHVCVNVFWIAVFIAVVIQAHRVIGWAHRYGD